ncbi:Thioesterase domain-containing protein [Streptomyces sp. Ncost-T6T-2b]|nr:Thioesterase domain-containing protein [Streptomyces sp. Ncost-T6T-2b]
MDAKGQVSEGARADPEIMQIAVEILRADMRVMDTYRYRANERVSTPLHFLYGADDDLDGPGAAERWQQLGRAGFESTRLPGGHFYTPEVWARMPGHLSSLRPARHGSASAPVAT